ncbi:hypothetical protein [Pseudomonas sp.]|uniref:hypothetical protein n=1 Tax=Pseudomonas sp. TaxID=306 RepID=UPI003F314DF4
MEDDLVRVESAVAATASGNLTWEKWPYDCAMALGFAGQHNPLGFVLVRYREAQDSGGAAASLIWEVVLTLAKALEGKGINAGQLKDVAFQSLDVWNNLRCQTCGGRGVLNIEQRLCHVCKGTGQRDVSRFPEAVRDGLSALMEAERRMDGQLGRLRR